MKRIKNYDEACLLYGKENLVTVVNILQMLLYAVNDVQPICLGRGFNNKLCAYYLKDETKYVWGKWLDTNPKKEKE